MGGPEMVDGGGGGGGGVVGPEMAIVIYILCAETDL